MLEITKETSSKTTNVVGKYIWQMWWQGDDANMPPIVRKCVDSVRAHLPPGYSYVLLTEDNVHEYLSDCPEYIKNRVGENISITHFSDYVRSYVLYKYGGVWIDATCLMTDSIPEHILQAECFYFQSETYALETGLPSEKMLELYQKVPLIKGTYHTGSSWFLVSKKGNRLFGLAKSVLEQYWRREDRLVDYFLFHCVLSYAVLHDKESGMIFMRMQKFSNVFPHLLQFSLRYDEIAFDEAVRKCFVHKLTYGKDFHLQLEEKGY